MRCPRLRPRPAYEEFVQAQKAGEQVHVLTVSSLGNVVNVPQQVHRLDDRQIPPEARPLAEDRADVQDMLAALLPRNPAIDKQVPGTVGTRIPVSILRVVDFPAPLGPR